MMRTINRYNYEEFFLLYIDNELDAREKEAVEKFVQQNADLVVEMDMLMKSKYLPEEGIVFTNKENLIRTEGNSINENNYEEYFLLYIDNELSAAKRQEVETYILQHPRLQNVFTSLKEAVLEPDATVLYTNKEELYRSEKKRVVYLQPWRWAVAAAFISLCTGGWWLLQKPGATERIADIRSTNNQAKQNIQPAKTDSSQQNKQPEIVAQQASASKNEVNKTVVAKKKPVFEQKPDAIAKNTSSKQTLPSNKIEDNTIVKQNEQPVTHNNDVATNSDQPIKEEITGIAFQQVPDLAEQNTGNYNVYPVAYKEINTNDEDRSVYVGMLDLNKDKVKGLLKKAGRLFKNKSNNLANEDGKLQVANFEIETNKQ